MGQLEPANLGRMGAGESSTLAAEELALHQVGGKRGAVDNDQRRVRRELRRWIARASSSFPVPVSPDTSMVASVDAT